MRELRFRAFIKGKSVIRPVAYLKFSDDNELMMVGVFNNNHKISEFIPEDVVIDQLTGLKDKNGNEIYEGDIVKMSYGDTESLGVCKWTSQRSRFVLEDVRKYSEKSTTELFPENLLVIDNIHENPELLKDK